MGYTWLHAQGRVAARQEMVRKKFHASLLLRLLRAVLAPTDQPVHCAARQSGRAPRGTGAHIQAASLNLQ